MDYRAERPSELYGLGKHSLIRIQEMRKRLAWVQQSDGHSCGPLATATAIMLIQGQRPTRDALLFGDTVSNKAQRLQRMSSDQVWQLRMRVILLWLNAAVGAVKAGQYCELNSCNESNCQLFVAIIRCIYVYKV